MKPVYVRDLPALVNQTITSFFLVLSKEARLKKTGEPYISLMLGDCSGEVEARLWDNVEAAPAFERDDFIKVKGLVQCFRNKPQIAVHKLRRLNDGEVEAGDFFAKTPRDVEEMFAELAGFVAGVRNAHLRALLEAVLADAEIAERLKRAPAAKTLHHAYLGGLLEHIVSLCQLSDAAARHYPVLDRDLLITAALLHDLGKIRELDYRRSIAYSTEGQLLGHIVIGIRITGEKMAAVPGFPESLRVLVEHLIASHHGEHEFGSPALPRFPEALVFHYLDDLDSKVNSLTSQLHSDPLLEGEWTARNASLGRPMLKLEKYGACAPADAGSPAGAEAPAPAGAEQVGTAAGEPAAKAATAEASAGTGENGEAVPEPAGPDRSPAPA